MEISCPSAWTSLSGYMEYELSALNTLIMLAKASFIVAVSLMNFGVTLVGHRSPSKAHSASWSGGSGRCDGPGSDVLPTLGQRAPATSDEASPSIGDVNLAAMRRANCLAFSFTNTGSSRVLDGRLRGTHTPVIPVANRDAKEVLPVRCPAVKELMFVEAGRVEWTHRPQPELTDPAGVLVRPTAVARCDLDLPMAKVGLFPGPFPVGHETVAEVIAVGGQVTNTRPGDKVLVPFQVSCGQCARCRSGKYAACELYSAPLGAMFGFGHSGGDHGGSLADVLFVPDADHMLIQAPRSLPDVGLAMLTDNAVDAYRSVGPPLAAFPGADVLIAAATPGSIALYATALAVALGAGSVRYVDRNPRRVDVARELGADAYLQQGPWPAQFDTAEVTVDVTAEPDGLATVLRSTEPYGTCTSVAVYFSPTTPMPLLDMYTHGVTFNTSRVDARRYLPDLVDLVEEERFNPLDVPTTVIEWDDAPRAWLDPAIKLVVRR